MKEEPILDNVETFRPLVPAHRQHILANLESLVVKAVDASGGYGMLIGPASTRAATRGVRPQDRGQPPRLHRPADDLSLSRHPTFVDGRLDGRHIDLRPFVLYGEEIMVMPGGLTRVALPEGSLVVNSSQGGGTKDTWVLHDGRPARSSAEPADAPSRSRRPEMLSRVAENLFWMSRYLERAENVARLLDIGLYLELDAPASAGEDGSAPVEIALDILACRDAVPLPGHRSARTGTPSSGFSRSTGPTPTRS